MILRAGNNKSGRNSRSAEHSGRLALDTDAADEIQYSIWQFCIPAEEFCTVATAANTACQCQLCM